MVKVQDSLVDLLNEWSDSRDEVDVYTGDDKPSYSGFIIHVGTDYLAMGNEEGRNLYDTAIPIANITRIRVLVGGSGVESWESTETSSPK
jgi:hypothetical protein